MVLLVVNLQVSELVEESELDLDKHVTDFFFGDLESGKSEILRNISGLFIYCN